jgi:hypothetical protein
MPLSVTQPVQPAIEQTKKVLFAPFDLGKWLGLGFCAFLAMLGRGGGGGGNVQGPGGGGPGGGAPDLEPVIDWIRENAALLAAIVGGVLLLSLALAMLLTWLSGRGEFMFLDGVVRNRGAVVEPWHEYRREGNSLFRFRFALVLLSMLVMLLLLAVCGVIAWPDLNAQRMGGGVMLAMLLGVLGILGFTFVMALVQLFLKDFVVPIMYLQRISTMEAWRIFNSEMVPGNLGKLVLYVLMKILIACVTMAAATGLMCATCCIAALPYVSSVFLLPLLVFERAYSLYFIGQFGPQWKVFPGDEDLVEADFV